MKKAKLNYYAPNPLRLNSWQSNL